MSAGAGRGTATRIAWPLRIYYDARCPLCARELGVLAQHDRGRKLQLVDCSAPCFDDDDVRAAGLDATTLMARIHARDADGAWHVGVPVFEAAYAAAGLQAMARAFAHPRLRPLWDRLYPWIADHRMGLSRLGLDRPYGWLIARAAGRAARRADRRAGSCAAGTCAAPVDAETPTHGGHGRVP